MGSNIELGRLGGTGIICHKDSGGVWKEEEGLSFEAARRLMCPQVTQGKGAWREVALWV